MYRKRMIINRNSGAEIVAWNTGQRSASGITIVDVDGWDTIPPVRKNSAQLLWGNGRTSSKAATYAERYVTVVLHAQYPKNVNIRGLRSTALVMANDPNATFEIEIEYYDDRKAYLREVMRVRIDSDFMEWDEMNNSVRLTLNFVADNPYKTQFINGSTTPQPNGVL